MLAKQDLLRSLPKIDELLRQETLQEEIGTAGGAFAAEAARALIEELRQRILGGATEVPTDLPSVAGMLRERLCQSRQPGLRPVLNATGVVLHTNLGRAPLSKAAAEAAAAVAAGYSTLEYDLDRGTRGSRTSHIERLLCELCGCEAAAVVNNNAAAVLIALSEIARGREVIVSRGELVEIGGAFRVPEIMEQSGCVLREVGTTNKTRLSDYERAVGETTGALLKVHTSNYRIVGFVEETPLETLVAFGHAHQLPVLYDLGSGALLPPERFGIHGEPDVPSAVKSGADLVTFSGDKLLGGPQAGILLGRKSYIDRIKRHPLMRAFRMDKLGLAALEATLLAYRNPERAIEEIPNLRMLAQPLTAIEARADRLVAQLARMGIPAERLADHSQVGGGSAPTQLLPTAVVALRGIDPVPAEVRLRRASTPVIARIAHDRLLFDMRTLADEEVGRLAEIIGEVVHA